MCVSLSLSFEMGNMEGGTAVSVGFFHFFSPPSLSVGQVLIFDGVPPIIHGKNANKLTNEQTKKK